MHALLLVGLLSSGDSATAGRAFVELRTMCEADSGRMWGRSLCGPVVFADPRTRAAITEQGPATIPDSIGIANTAVDWDGQRWTMVMWPLPESTIARRVLLAHESFHRIQKDLSLPAASPANAHLDSADARYWMRLEWRALARALATRERDAVADALAFRERRRAIGENAAEDERLLEINEGLAEYTGYALAAPHIGERIAPLVRRLAQADKGEQFARSFAYNSGPAWGTLIEMRDRHWTRRLRAADDLGALARRAWKIASFPTLREDRYGADAVRADESARAERKRALFAGLREKFIDGPVLIIPLRQMQFTFDPNRAQPFGEHGTVYPSMEVRDGWGTIVVKNGGLISPDYGKLVVPLSEEGFELTLSGGWRMTEGTRAGDRTLVKD